MCSTLFTTSAAAAVMDTSKHTHTHTAHSILKINGVHDAFNRAHRKHGVYTLHNVHTNTRTYTQIFWLLAHIWQTGVDALTLLGRGCR